MMKKRSLRIAGHTTSVALEPEFWQALEDIACQRSLSLGALISFIDQNHPLLQSRNLASLLRVFTLQHYWGNFIPLRED